MAPVYTSSSSSSRRTKRRQQRHHQRCYRQQQLSEQFWKQTGDEQPASQPRDWLEMNEDRIFTDSAGIQDQATDFWPSIKDSTHSNPFSVLDVGIPSPTLKFPKSAFTNHSQQPDAPTTSDIYGIGVSTGCSPQPSEIQVSKKLRRDSWASNLQKEGLVKSSYDPLIQDMMVSPPATTVVPYTKACVAESSLDHSYDNSNTVSDSNFRVPSPLLYHRRSRAAFPGSSESSEHGKSLKFTHTRLMSEIRTKTHQLKQKPLDDNQEPIFVAARLPLMGSAAMSEKSAEHEPLSNNLTAAGTDYVRKPLPPILTAAKVYLCPQKLCQIFDYPSDIASIPRSLDTLNSPWFHDESLVFPTLTVSGQLQACKSDSLDTKSVHASTANTMLQPAAVHVVPMHFLETRDRSSTQESLDNNFTVAGAVLTDQSKRKRVGLQESSTAAPVTSSTQGNSSISDTEHQIVLEAAPNFHASDDSIAESQATVLITRNVDDDVPSPGHFLFQDLDDDLLGTVTVSKDEAMSSDDEWNWADDQWQSDVTTPQSLDTSQIGLCAAEWV